MPRVGIRPPLRSDKLKPGLSPGFFFDYWLVVPWAGHLIFVVIWTYVFGLGASWVCCRAYTQF